MRSSLDILMVSGKLSMQVKFVKKIMSQAVRPTPSRAAPSSWSPCTTSILNTSIRIFCVWYRNEKMTKF